MKLNLIILTILATSFCSCKKDTFEGTPPCITDKIKSLEESSVCSDPSVDEYLFQAETVYVFEPGTCGADMSSAVYDTKCNVKGHLGGYSGDTKIDGVEFSTATFIQTIWEK